MRSPAVLILACAFASAGAGATVQRTFVASRGNDANPCTLASPCRSFGAAIAQTNDRGEIVVLDSAGYGSVTIGKSVTIAAPSGVYAGISVFSGANGVTIDGPGIAVTLRGLTINGQGGSDGIAFVQGASLAVERCTVDGMANAGISAQLGGDAFVRVRDTTLSRNTNFGLQLEGAGRASLDGVRVSGSGIYGIYVHDGPSVAMRDLSVERNQTGIGVFALNVDTSATLSHSRVFANNRNGVLAQASGPGTILVTLAVADSEIVRNNRGLYAPAAGVFVQGLFATRAHATLTRSRVSYNNGAGVYAQHAGTVAYVDGCAVEANTGYGVVAVPGTNDDATLYTTGDNTIEDNAGGDASGNVVPYGGPT